MTDRATPSNPFRLGFLTHVEGADDPQRIYRETLELFVAADALGFEVGWVAQHHFDKAGRLPSPFPLLAAAAARTRHIRLGTAVVVLPFENPFAWRKMPPCSTRSAAGGSSLAWAAAATRPSFRRSG